MTSIDRVTVDGSAMEIHVAQPAGAGPHPAVVLLYHREGVDDFTRQVMQRYAEGGYLVAVPDVSHRCDAATPMQDRKAHLRDSQVVADIAATVSYLKARRDVAGDRLAIIGHCMGGRMAMLGAGKLHDFRACVSFYGGGVFTPWNEDSTPAAVLPAIACPVLGFFGNLDPHPSPADVDRMDAELTRAGVAHEFHRYDGVGHGFQQLSRNTPAERAAREDGWDKTFRFLAVALAPAGARAEA